VMWRVGWGGGQRKGLVQAERGGGPALSWCTV